MGDGVSNTSGPQEAGNDIQMEEYAPPSPLLVQGFPAQGLVCPGHTAHRHRPPGQAGEILPADFGGEFTVDAALP